jgi:hypothetical protein
MTSCSARPPLGERLADGRRRRRGRALLHQHRPGTVATNPTAIVNPTIASGSVCVSSFYR